MNEWRPGLSRDALKARAALLSQLRQFFAERAVLEVDTPLLATYGVTDPHIEPLTVDSPRGPHYLQTSPEFAMKRLLAHGSGDIYQLGKVFRGGGEEGGRHNPEFTMLEWYRLDFSLEDLMAEVAELVALCLDRDGCEFHAYRDLFSAELAMDPFTASTNELALLARERVDWQGGELDRDSYLDLLMSHCVEPALKDRGLVFIHSYPPSQAALARCSGAGEDCVAERFELYVDGLELANGYRELLDPQELERRAIVDNRKRRELGRAVRTLDPRLLAAMEAGLPDCSGVALGVDRLLMCRLGAATISEVLPFDWSRA